MIPPQRTVSTTDSGSGGPGLSVVDYLVLTVISGTLGAALAGFALAFSDEVGQLALLCTYIYALSYLPTGAVQWWATFNDGVVDAYERLFVTLATFVQWLLFFMTTAFVMAWLTAFISAGPLPSWPVAIACGAVLVVTVLAFMPYVINSVASLIAAAKPAPAPAVVAAGSELTVELLSPI